MDDARMQHAPAPQPSSAVTTLRALVMLACLIGLPALALRVTELPFPLREYVIEWLGGTVAKTETRADLDEAPPFVPPAGGMREPVIEFPQEAVAASNPGVSTIRLRAGRSFRQSAVERVRTSASEPIHLPHGASRHSWRTSYDPGGSDRAADTEPGRCPGQLRFPGVSPE